MYDIFFTADSDTDPQYQKIKSKYPRTILISKSSSFEDIKNKSFTKMFWVIWNDLELDQNFNLNSYKATKWDDMYVHVFKNGEHYDGICLFPKSSNISSKEFDYRFFTNKKEIDIIASNPKPYDIFQINSYQDYLDASKQASTAMFWAIWNDIVVDSNFKFDYTVPSYDRNIVHVFKNGEHYDGICLFPKNSTISKREFYHRFFSEKKEIDIVASVPKQYNIYSPTNYDEYKSITDDMFWLVWPEVEVIDNSIFKLYFSHHNAYDRRENHIFKNKCNNTESFMSGVVLCSKYKQLSLREFEKQYIIEKKEYNIVASKFRYPKYTITSYDEYLNIVENESQKMFWCIWPEIKIIDQTIFDLYFDPNDGKYDYDREENHVFKNSINGEETYRYGLVLFSKKKIISKKEFDRKYLIDKKENNLLVSRLVYPKHVINTYDEYLNIIENNKHHDLFWCQWPEIEVTDQSIFNLYFDPNDGKYDYDRSENHVFKNSINEKETYRYGLVLFSNKKIISKKEFDRKYLIDKKEHDVLVSKLVYPKYIINTYEEYLEILNKENAPLFWCQWPEIEVTDQSIFNLYFDPNDGKYDYDRSENHVFKHQFNDQEIFVNSLTLFSKEKVISHREFTHRFLIEKKEHDRLVSKHQLYDVVFISYDELNADQNYSKLLEICPRAKRIHKIKGIHQAHIEAAKISTTDMFWVVDGDSIIVKDFDFNLVMSSYDKDCVHVWRSQNPINDLEYGNGGVKLLPRILTLNVDVNSPDMTTSISKKFKPVAKVSNINSFNTDEFSTWRSAFRECCKLASRVIDRQQEEETYQRLEIWCTKGADKPFGKFAINGAQLGKSYGEKNKNNIEALKKINDFDWLKNQFEKTYE